MKVRHHWKAGSAQQAQALVVLAALAWAPLAAEAQPTALGDEIRVNVRTQGDQDAPSVATAADGSFVVVFNDSSLPAGGIYARRYAADGTPRADAFLVQENASNAVVASAADGAFTVAWGSMSDGDVSGIFARRYDADGIALGAALRVNTTTDGDQADPAIGCDAAGACVIVWDTISSGVSAQWYDAAGGPVGGELPVDDDPSVQHFPAVAVDADGSFVVAWNRLTANPAESAVYIRRFVGVNPGDVTLVAHTGSEHGTDPASLDVAVVDGTSTVVWSSAIYGDPNTPSRPIPPDVNAQRYDAGVVATGGRIAVTAEPERRQHHPVVAALPSGGFVVVWQNDALDAGTGANRVDNIVGRQFSAAGEPVGEEFFANPTFLADHRQPAIAADAEGNFVVAWYGIDESGRGVFARRFAAAVEPEPTGTSTPTESVEVTATETPSVDPTATSIATATSVPTSTATSEPTSTAPPTATVPRTATSTAPASTSTPTEAPAATATQTVASGGGCSTSGREGSSALLLLLAAPLALIATRRR